MAENFPGGFGGGGGFGGSHLAAILARRSIDPNIDARLQLGQGLIGRGTDTSPAYGKYTALSRVLQGGLGALMTYNALNEMRAAEDKTQQTFRSALEAGQGIPVETKTYRGQPTVDWTPTGGMPGAPVEYGQGVPPGTTLTTPSTTINWNPVKGDQAKMAAILAGDRGTRDFGLQMQLADMNYGRTRADTLSDAEAAYNRSLAAGGLAIKDGKIVRVPGFGEAVGGNKAAELGALIPVEKNKIETLTPAVAGQAGATATAQLKAQNLPTPVIVGTSADGTPIVANVPAAAIAPLAVAGQKTAIERGEKITKVEHDWRAQLSKPLNEAAEVVRQGEIIKSGLARGDGTGDIASITAFNKLLDPGAVVREADVALTLSAMGLADKLTVWVANKHEGDILSPEMRGRMAGLANQVVEKSMEVHRARLMPYRSAIENDGGSFERVLPPELRAMFGWQEPPAGIVGVPSRVGTPAVTGAPAVVVNPFANMTDAQILEYARQNPALVQQLMKNLGFGQR